MAKGERAASVYLCQECGYETPKWLGRCPNCAGWGALVERSKAKGPPKTRGAELTRMSDLDDADPPRLELGLEDFNRALGGGVVDGSVILIGGDPGIGKSTLLMQAAAHAALQGPVLYISGEESTRQVRLRAQRLKSANTQDLYLLAETDLDAALQVAEGLAPVLTIVDSIQSVYSSDIPSPPGSVTQLRECTVRLMRWAKGIGGSVIMVGHVTKEGELAGPRVLEHLVDVVLYLEGERFSSYRLLRSSKNRFGSAEEVGVFEMTGRGLVSVENPSAVLLAERAQGAVGSAIVPTIEGTRPLLMEVQALTSANPSPTPRRVANGLDNSRLLVIAAVLARRAGLALGGHDIVVSIAGGFRVQEPAADLAIALAIASSFKDKAIAADIVVMGEIGLSGELRSVAQLERRLLEAERLGFKRALVPKAALKNTRLDAPIEIMPAATLLDALALTL